MIKAIPTIYNGQKYRSKLEAEYAKGMDEAGVKFIYEPEGFEFSDGTRYLPDFYLPDYDRFIEVKGVMTDYDKKKIDLFRAESDKVLFVVDGGDLVLPTIIKDLCICGCVEKAEGLQDCFFLNDVGFFDESQKKIFCNIWFFSRSTNCYCFSGSNEQGKFLADTMNISDPFFMKCPECHKLTLHANEDSWTCGHCGYYDGDNFESVSLEDVEDVIIQRSYIDYRNNK